MSWRKIKLIIHLNPPGYLVLIISSGYLFGFVKGIFVVILGANLGVAIAHNTIKSIQGRLPIHR